jgi:hypothetical protein
VANDVLYLRIHECPKGYQLSAISYQPYLTLLKY